MRGGGFSPSQIATALWLDAYDAATVTEVDGKVSAFADKSGNGIVGTQSDAALRPVRTGNGIVFTVDFLTLGVPASINFAPADDYSVFCVAKYNGATSYIITKLNASSSSPFSLLFNGPSAQAITPYGSSNIAVGDTASALCQMGVVCPQTTGPGLARLNGGATTSLTRGSTNTTANGIDFLLGARRATGNTGYGAAGNFTLHEIIVLGSAASDALRTTAEGYLAHKWDSILGVSTLKDALPSGHAYKTIAP